MDYETRLEAERTANDVSPPWEVFPEYDAYTIGWRMGVGEWWNDEWLRKLDGYPDRLAYLRSHRPAPVSFAHWVDGALNPDSTEYPLSDSRLSELAKLGLIGNDVAFGSWLANHPTPPPPWETTLDSDITLTYIAPRDAYFWTRWCHEQRDADLLAPSSYSPPPEWRELWEVVAVGAEPTNLPPLETGWPRLTFEQARHGAAPPPWLFGCDVEAVRGESGKEAEYAGAWLGWTMHVFDDRAMWEKYLSRWTAPDDEWLPVLSKIEAKLRTITSAHE